MSKPNSVKLVIADHLKQHETFLNTDPYGTFTFASYSEPWQVQIMANYNQATQFACGAYKRDNDTGFGEIVLIKIN